MANILIIDQLQQTGALMKKLLSNYYNVSLSENTSDAIRKIETALFDVVIMELERLNSDAEKFIKETKEMLPQLPIIIMSEHQDNLQSTLRTLTGSLSENPERVDCLKIMRRPFRCAALMESIAEGLFRYNTTTEVSNHHRSITCNVEISQNNNKTLTPLKCSLIDLSLMGMLIEPLIVFAGRSQENEKTRFQSFFKTLCPDVTSGRIYSKPLHTNILIKEPKGTAVGPARRDKGGALSEQEPIGLDARIAFVENSPDDVFKKAGLSFNDSNQQKNRLIELLKQT